MLDKLVVELFGLVGEVCRDVLNLRSAVAVLEDEHLLHDEVDDSVEAFTSVHWELDRSDLIAEILFQLMDGVVEVGVVVVELVHEEHHRLVCVGGVFPCVFCSGLNTRL